jgi:hypothetical protein
MREVCVHNYDEISGAKLQPVDVGGSATWVGITTVEGSTDMCVPEPELTRPRFQHLFK